MKLVFVLHATSCFCAFYNAKILLAADVELVLCICSKLDFKLEKILIDKK